MSETAERLWNALHGGKTVSHDAQVKQEPPERVWITWDDAYPWPTPEMGGDEYVRADLLATVRREEREAALEIVKRLTPPSNRLAQMFHKRVIAALEASASEKGEVNG